MNNLHAHDFHLFLLQTMSYSYNCTNCNKQIFLDNDAVEVQKNHICAGIEHATNLILSENG